MVKTAAEEAAKEAKRLFQEEEARQAEDAATRKEAAEAEARRSGVVAAWTCASPMRASAELTEVSKRLRKLLQLLAAQRGSPVPIVRLVACARNVVACARNARWCGEAELVSPVLPLAELVCT